MLQLRPLDTPSAANGVASNGVGVATNGVAANGHGNGAGSNGHANGASHASHGGRTRHPNRHEGGGPDRGPTSRSHGRQKVQAVSIKGMLEAQQWGAALWMLEEPSMKSAARLQACNGCISACGRASFWRQAMWLMNNMKAMVRMPSPTSVSLSACALACERALQWHHVLTLLEKGRLERLLRDNVNPSSEGSRSGRQRAAELAALTAACRACSDAEQWRSSMELLPKLFSGSLEPNVLTFGTAFQICSHGQGTEALQLYQEMRRSGLEQGIISCNQVMMACTTSQLWKDSLDLMSGAKQDGLQNSPATISSAVKNPLLWSQVMQVLRDARRGRVELSEIAAGSAMTTCSRDEAFAWQHATSFLAMEEAVGLQRNVFSITATMKSCTLWREVLSFYPLLATTKPSRLANVVAYNTMGDSCEKSSSVDGDIWRLTLQFLDRDLQAKSLQGDQISAYHLTAATAKGSWKLSLELAVDLLDSDGLVFLAAKVAPGNWQLAISLLPPAFGETSRSAFSDLCVTLDKSSQWPMAVELLMEQAQQRNLPSGWAYSWAFNFLMSKT